MWVGGVLVSGGLGLIVLGGCFLIGAWIMIGAHALGEPDSEGWSLDSRFLLVVLYILAFSCVVGAAILITCGVRSLLGLLKA